jgi:peroxiredoxin
MTASPFRFFLLISTLIIPLLFTCCQRKGHDHNVHIALKVKGSRGEMIYLEKVTIDASVLLDSMPINKKGEVSFSLHTSDFEFVMAGNRKGKKILLLAEKGQNIQVFTAAGLYGDQYTVQGSAGSTLLHKLEQQKGSVLQKIDSLGQAWLKERYTGDHLERKVLFDSLLGSIMEEHKSWLLEFLQKYNESPAMIVALYQTFRPGQPVLTMEGYLPAFQNIATTLAPLYPSNDHVKDLIRRVDDFVKEQEAYQQRETQLRAGNQAPPVSLFNTRGEKVTLEAYQGRVVLLYFWDARKRESWDLNKQLADLHRQYRARGFEILGIYTGEDKQLYFNAIQIDGLPWVHLLGNTHTVNLYNVKEVPSMLLIDREGKVLHRTISFTELAAKLPWILPAQGVALPGASVQDVQ